MDKRTNTTVYPGFSLGSERELLAQETSLYKAYAAPLLQNLIFHNLSYDIDTFSFERDVAQVDAIAGPLIDEIGVDLSAFQRRGGKMVVTQGWTDPLNAATWPIQHLEQLQQSSTEKANKTSSLRWRDDDEVPPNGHDADQPSDENVCGGANYASEASFAFEEMLGCLKDLRDRYEIPEKFIQMLRQAQNQRDMTLNQVTIALEEIDRLSKKMEKMVEEETERRTNMYRSLQVWIEAVDRTQEQQHLDEAQQQQQPPDES
ncbi:hypothetical protein PoHVEF18_006998 [Penicillium ochrochloron]